MPGFDMKIGPSKKNAGSLSFRRRRKKIEKEKIGGAFLLLAEIAAVAALAFAVVWFFGYRVRMTGQSMETGISDGDYLLLNRTAYLVHGPRRGDIIAFYPSGNPNANPTIKRVMGLPGDRLKVEDGYLYINGEEYKGTPDYKGIDDPGVLASEITLGDDGTIFPPRRTAASPPLGTSARGTSSEASGGIFLSPMSVCRIDHQSRKGVTVFSLTPFHTFHLVRKRIE